MYLIKSNGIVVVCCTWKIISKEENNNRTVFTQTCGTIYLMNGFGTQAFSFETGKELKLFTFQNIGTTCFGSIELTNNGTTARKQRMPL